MNLGNVQNIDDLLSWHETAQTYQRLRADDPQLSAADALSAAHKHRRIRCGWCEGSGITPLGIHRCPRCKGEGAIMVKIDGGDQ